MGAARFVRGLARLVAPDRLTIIVNTGDDEEFYGLHVSPDLDTIVYTLAGMAPWVPGWGVAGDTFAACEALSRLYGKAWFALGDRDLATHLFRSHSLRSGSTLSACTATLCERFGVRQRVLPMSDDRIRTLVKTSEGTLAFQDYLVRRRARPAVTGVSFAGARKATPAAGVLEAIRDADLVVIAPSNPIVSLGPMLAVPGIRAALRARCQQVVAISPIVDGRAVKGPLVRMLRGLGHRPDNSGIARLYAGLAGRLLVAKGEAPRRAGPASWPRFVETDILMVDEDASERLAHTVLSHYPARPLSE